MRNTNNYGKETEENLKPLYVNLVIKFLVGEISDNPSVVMGKGKGGCGLFILGFFILIIFYFPFENQTDGCDKQQNICFKLEYLILKIFVKIRILA